MNANAVALPRLDWVERLVPNPAAPPRLRRLRGLPGPAGDPDWARLYLDPELNAYVDFPRAAVRLARPAPFGGDPTPGCDVWLDRDAPTRDPASAAEWTYRPEVSAWPTDAPWWIPNIRDTTHNCPSEVTEGRAHTCGEPCEPPV